MALTRNSEYHFSDEQWSDYVRDLTPEAESGEMRRHLRTGCGQCRKAERFWSKLYEVGQSNAYAPPEEAVRAVERFFERPRSAVSQRERWIWAEIVFDSMLHPLPMGVRSSNATARRLMTRAGNWIIDLQLERRGGAKFLVTGQVSNSRRRTSKAMAVSLMRDDTVFETSTINELGEFQISCEPGGGLHLRIDAPGRTSINVPLPTDPAQADVT
jgi:hypothetical protein